MAEILETPITVVHVFVCLMLVLIILIQPGKSGGLGAALGGAGAQQVFGGRGAGTFLSRATWIFAVIFFSSSVVLAYFSSSVGDSLEDLATSQAQAAEDTLKAEESKAKQDAENAASTAPSAASAPVPAPGEEIVIDPTEAAPDEPGATEGAAEGEPAAPAGESDPAATAKESAAAVGPAKTVVPKAEVPQAVVPKGALPNAAVPRVPAPMAPKASVPAPSPKPAVPPMAPAPAAPAPMVPAPAAPAPMAPKPATPPSAPAAPGQ